jgi:L-iditol 2-dehydrogenase
VPKPGPSEVLVQVQVVGVCGSDVHYFREGRIGSYVPTGPLVLGHEASGVVVAVGPFVERLSVGQRVAIEPGAPCARCSHCRGGRYNLCPQMRFLAHPPTDGAFLEYLTVDEQFAHPVPAAVSDEAAALVEPLAVALWAARLAEVTAGDHVLVTGAGPIGLLAIQAAQALGATSVTVTDIDPTRLDFAASLGASTLNVGSQLLEDVPLADVLIECSGVPDVIGGSLSRLHPRGRVALVGLSAEGVATIPTALIQERELQIRGVFRYANVFPLAVRLVAAGIVDPTRIVTDRFPLERTDEALASSQQPGTVKPVVLVGAASPES